MTMPQPPKVFNDWGLVTVVTTSQQDWGLVTDTILSKVDYEAGSISSTNQITKPVDKIWAFIGREEDRPDGDRS